MRRAAVGAALGALLVAGVAGAAPVRLFRAQSADTFSKGESEAVAVDAAGVLALAPAAEKIAALDEPFAFAFARHGEGWAVGTGSDGRVLAIDAKGGTTTLLDAEEPEIFALASIGGALYAGSSPGGKVYRIASGGSGAPSSAVWFDPPETYVWAIAPAPDGTFWVATGAPGRLYRVSAEGKGEKVWEGATHVRSLLPLANGDLLFGTAGDGRLLRWRAGAVRTLHDSELTEVAALAAGEDGAVWIALLASESSFVDLSPRSAAAAEGDESKPAVAPVDDGSAGSRPSGAVGPRSELIRLLPNGGIEGVWRSDDETLFALLPDGDGVWAATGLEGRLYRITGGAEAGRARVERKFESRQLVGLAPGAHGPVVLATNGAALWRLVERREAKGTYTSPVLDAGQVATFGVFRWEGLEPAGAHVRVSFRSGFAAEPDATWSEWSAPREGREVPVGVERARFVQYRLELSGGSGTGDAGASPRVASTELSYRQENLRPVIALFAAMDPGQIQVPSGFNAADQLYEPASPNREGIFDTLKATPPRGDRLRTLWRKGWLTLRWDAADPNGDPLEHRLEVRAEGSPGGWLEIAREIEESSWAFDATALPDGVYRFRLTTTDAPGNEAAAAAGGALEARRESEPVTIDQSAPELVATERSGATIEARVEDAWSPLRSAEISVDGAAWRPARVRDGLLDGRSETLESPLPAKGARMILLRVVDAAFNVRTFDLLAGAGRERGR